MIFNKIMLTAMLFQGRGMRTIRKKVGKRDYFNVNEIIDYNYD